MKVTFEDKEGIIPYGTRINQVQDRDLNEIKLAINTNDDRLTEVEASVAAIPLDSTAIGDPTVPIVLTGNVHCLGVGAGTYSFWGGMVVPANNFGTLKRVAGIFSVNLTAITDASKIMPWVAQSYVLGAQVNHLGIDWVSNASTVAGDIPGASTKWIDRLLAYAKNIDVPRKDKSLKIELGKNIFNYLDVTIGQISITTGLIDLGQPNWRISNYIEVPALTQISINTIYRIVEYDINKVLITGSETAPQAQKTFTTSANTAFIRINDYYSNIPIIQIEIGATSTTYEAYKISEISKLNSNESVSFYNKNILGIQEKLNTIPNKQIAFERAKNLLNPSTLILGTLNQLTGVLTPGGTTWKYSDYIEVLGNQAISILFVYRIAEYNVDKVFITGQQNDSQGQKTFTTNVNTRYIVIYGYHTTFVNNQVEIGSASTAYEAYSSDLKVLQAFSGEKIYFNPIAPFSWKDKTILFLGDSVTFADLYQKTVKSVLSLSASVTKAKGGLGIIQIIDGDGAGHTALTSAELAGIDAIVFFGGLNDRASLAGTITDLYPTQTTTTGRYRYVINKLYTLLAEINKKDTRIIFVAPHKVGKYSYIDADGGQEYPVGSGQTLETIVNKLKELCGFYGIPVVDLYHNSGINNFTWDVLTANTGGGSGSYPANLDNVHPNAKGYEQIGRYIAKSINQL